MTNEENFESVKERLRRFLIEVKKNNLYYCNMLNEFSVNLNENNFGYSEFIKIPIMSKSEYRIVQSEIDKALVGEKTTFIPTSGSTGNPLTVWRTFSDDVRMKFILNKYRNNYLNGIIAKKGIHFHFSYHKRKEKDWQSGNLSIVYMNSNFFRARYYFLGEIVYKKSVELINKEKPVWIVGSVSFLYNLALYILKEKALKHQVLYIECNSEYLGEERYTIEKAFNIMPVSIYGANEFNGIAYECRCGKMHVLQENVFFEIEENTRSVIATSIANVHNPFIRYKLGDLAEWGEKCYCSFSAFGSTTIKLSGFRSGDILRLEDEKEIDLWYFSEVIRYLKEKKNISVKQYKIIRYLDGIKFLITLEDIDNKKKEIVGEFLKNEMNSIIKLKDKLVVEFVDNITPDSVSGKIKYLVVKHKNM